ncbi:MAG: hypothetical protein GAK30_00728 [Paracidovorax wautersii]|uniref:3-hydroxylacyl-ACP dehydratase n=1 Tax=Paracidovorax wautersii TaxID=1177982 RepID=A0A7V8FR45_9BURK|nr:MAG: hypothetical protein GAK30_00728 [Paracidovorax wautersii]
MMAAVQSQGSVSWPPVASLLPHHGNMVLLDEMLACDEQSAAALLCVKPDTPLSHADGRLPASAGIELMGQIVAAWAGWHALQQGQPVALGFLLGTRRYACRVPAFRPGERLRVSCVRTLDGGNGMSVFECAIAMAIEPSDSAAPTVLAEARLNVFKPPSVGEYLQESPP